MDNSTLDRIVEQITRAIPAGLSHARDDLNANAKAVLQEAFSRLDLVSRQEFDIQTKVLARTREKIEELEKVVGELEEKVKNK